MATVEHGKDRPINALETFVKGFHDVASINKMEYNRLGNTDMNVSRLALGTSAFGGVYGDVGMETSYDILESCIRSGVNYIDTAPWYGHGIAEQVLGKALQHKHIPRKSYYIATKVGRYEKQIGQMFDFSAERVLRSIDESLQRIGLDYIDLVQVHDMEFAPSFDIIVNETLPALQKAKDSGKIKYIGITGYPMGNFKKILERSTVQIDTVLSYCHYTLNDTSLLDHIPYFKSKEVGIINASPTSMGLLTKQGPPLWHPAQTQIKDTCRAAASYAKENDVDIARLALNFSYNNKDVSTTIITANKLEYMKQNINTISSQLTEEEERVLAHVREKYFIPLNNLSWDNIEVEIYKKEMQKILNGDKRRSDPDSIFG